MSIFSYISSYGEKTIPALHKKIIIFVQTVLEEGLGSSTELPIMMSVLTSSVMAKPKTKT